MNWKVSIALVFVTQFFAFEAFASGQKVAVGVNAGYQSETYSNDSFETTGTELDAYGLLGVVTQDKLFVAIRLMNLKETVKVTNKVSSSSSTSNFTTSAVGLGLGYYGDNGLFAMLDLWNEPKRVYGEGGYSLEEDETATALSSPWAYSAELGFLFAVKKIALGPSVMHTRINFTKKTVNGTVEEMEDPLLHVQNNLMFTALLFF